MVPRFLYPLLPYRSFLPPFLVACAITLPCWLIVRLYRRRTAGRRLPAGREILLLVFVVYLSGLAAATLTPNHGSRAHAATEAGIDLRPSLASLTCSTSLVGDQRARAFCRHNATGNVMLFLPLGLLIPLVWTRLRFWRGMQMALALSVGIELVQYLSRAWGSGRSADVNDVILNGVGAGLGLMLVSLPRLVQGSRGRRGARDGWTEGGTRGPGPAEGTDGDRRPR